MAHTTAPLRCKDKVRADEARADEARVDKACADEARNGGAAT
ncbi:MAG TPA: hypothetical protein VL595_17470 [Pseudonocardia sp.]|nr:hypothetical protein [Pseudonocardia sp.]